MDGIYLPKFNGGGIPRDAIKLFLPPQLTSLYGTPEPFDKRWAIPVVLGLNPMREDLNNQWIELVGPFDSKRAAEYYSNCVFPIFSPDLSYIEDKKGDSDAGS